MADDKKEPQDAVLDLTKEESGAEGPLPRPDRQSYDPAKSREWTRGLLSGGLLLILAIVITVPLIMLWKHGAPMSDLKELLTIVCAPLVALVGAAIGFYFSERSKK